MRSFKYLKQIFQIVIILIFLFCAEMIASNVLVEPNSSHYFDYDVQNIIKKGENVDMIFLGSSRVQLTFAPYIIEKELNLNNVLNAGSAAQPICASYYLLKYLFECFDPEFVVLGIANSEMLSYDKPDLQASLVVMDRLPFNDRLSFCMREFPDDLLYLSNLYRYRSNIGESGWIDSCRERCQTLANIKKGIFDIDLQADSYYVGNGYAYHKQSDKQGAMGAEDIAFDVMAINEDNLKYLDDIVLLCKERGVRLYLVTGITSMERMFSTKNYQDSYDLYSEYAANNDIKYFNLNYLVGRENFIPDTLMYDRNHVNGKGAEIVSKIFSEIIDKDMKGEDISGYFYASFDELKKDVNRIISIGYNMEVEDNTVFLDLRCLTNDTIVPEYRVLILNNDGEYIPITDFSIENSYVFNTHEYDDFAYHEYDFYIFRVEARQSGKDTIDAYQEYIRTDWKKNWQTTEEMSLNE